ncbi:hypothetical protein ACSV5K_25105 [Agrobacterium pusense]|uniref:hypothetical protein n=1 Tax=Agrobacterium pusense TaxID=648995 RepID=UPI003FD28D6F
MNIEDQFLSEKYQEFRYALRSTNPCTPFMPYGWFEPPETIRLDAEFGRQQMVYRDLAGDAARDLANDINHLIGLTMRLEAWQTVLNDLPVREKSELLLEFVQDSAAIALLSPYTLKARFYFAVAHLSHQANSALLRESWLDDFTTLPEDRSINEEAASKAAKPWRAWKNLIKALNAVDMRDYKVATDDFRSKHTHRFTPRVELGITQMVKRLPAEESGKICYGIGGSEPIKLTSAIRELKKQCVALSKCFAEFQKLVVEQSKIIFTGESD